VDLPKTFEDYVHTIGRTGRQRGCVLRQLRIMWNRIGRTGRQRGFAKDV